MRSSGRCPTAITRRRSRAGGPPNTGGVGARYGIVVTKGGVVFHAGGDGKVRAYDEDTGEVLVDGHLQRHDQRRPGELRVEGPAVLRDRDERRRRTSRWRRRSRRRSGGSAPAPIGAIAYALPEKK